MNFTDLINEASSNVEKTILVTSLAPLTTPSEATNTQRMAALYDATLESLAASGGEIIKHAGVSLFSVFDHPQHAAIHAATLHAKAMALSIATGIAHGPLVWFATTNRGTDFIGDPLERASGLSRNANPGGVFIDVHSSELLQGFTLGESNKASTTGQSEPVNFVEIIWAEKPFGTRRPARVAKATPTVNDERRPKPKQRENDNSVKPAQWLRGTVLRLGEKFGFITDRDGHTFYFQQDNLAVNTTLKRGANVVFRTFPPVKNTDSPRAQDIFVLGATTKGRVQRINNTGGWATVIMQCDNDLEHTLLVLGIDKTWSAGQTVQFTLAANDRGPIGINPTRPNAHNEGPSTVVTNAANGAHPDPDLLAAQQTNQAAPDHVS